MEIEIRIEEAAGDLPRDIGFWKSLEFYILHRRQDPAAVSHVYLRISNKLSMTLRHCRFLVQSNVLW